MADGTANTPAGSNPGGLSVGTIRVVDGLRVDGTAKYSGQVTTQTNTLVTLTFDIATTGKFLAYNLTPLVLRLWVHDTSAAAQVATVWQTSAQGATDLTQTGYGPANGQWVEIEVHKLWMAAVANGTADGDGKIFFRTQAATGGDGVLYYEIICARS